MRPYWQIRMQVISILVGLLAACGPSPASDNGSPSSQSEASGTNPSPSTNPPPVLRYLLLPHPRPSFRIPPQQRGPASPTAIRHRQSW